MMRHLLSCLSMMASHSGTCVVMPGWNGPKSPCSSSSTSRQHCANSRSNNYTIESVRAPR